MSTHIWRVGSIDTYQCLINAFIKNDKQCILLNRACERLFPESKCPLTLVYSQKKSGHRKVRGQFEEKY